jgi:hypothetical protein
MSETEITHDDAKVAMDALLQMKKAQGAKTRDIQAKLHSLGVEAFPCKVKVGDELQLGITIAYKQLSKLEALLSQIILEQIINNDEGN